MNKDYLLRLIKELFTNEMSVTPLHYMKSEVSLYEDPTINSFHVRLLLTESRLAYNFNISCEFLYAIDTDMLIHMAKSHIFNFIQQINYKIRSDNYHSNCTKELILEKYFDSYVYSKTASKDISYFEYVLNNPNIILRRGAGHTRALIDFIAEPTYSSITVDTVVVFNNTVKYNEFFSYGLRYFHAINLNNSINGLRGLGSKFFIFNSFQDCFRLIDQLALSGFMHHSSHFIILGE